MTELHLRDWRFEMDAEGVAWAVFDREGEKMNSLGRRATEELNEIVTWCEANQSGGALRGLVIISAKDNNFIAGADIREFDHLDDEDKVREAVRLTIGLFDRIEALKVPVVAAIHGYCLGGGLELAMACHYRIADREEGTRLGLPEVKLGIFPGLNGTVRALKLAGPVSGMEMMLTGRMLRPSAARAIGIVDQLVPTRHALRWAARKAVLQKRKSKGAPFFKRMLAMTPMRGMLARQMRRKTAEKAREDHYPAPFRLIDLFERFGDDPKRMAAAETDMFAPLMVSDTAKNLRRVFRLQEMLKDEAPKGGFRPLRVHVIGAGTMGADIAAWSVVCGMQASLQDLDQKQIDKAMARGKELFKKRLKGKNAVDAAVARFLPDREGRHVGRADVVIEAIVEKLDVKQALFRDLEPKLKPGAVLATNTSSLRIEDIAEALEDKGRLIGLHFFNPVPQLPLVEVVFGEDSREDEVRKGCAYVAAIQKLPLIVRSVPGFLVNRALAPYMMEAIRRYHEGEPRDKIDQAAVKFGMPMGPLELSDVVGLDICKHVGDTLGIAPQGDTILERLIAEGKLGKKTGEGFYVWEDGKPKRDDAEFPDADLDRLGRALVEPMIEVCRRAEPEGIVASRDHVDAGMIFGTGFAPFRGGPLHYDAQTDDPPRAAA
jgi:3-hydroxyacyl-CoA dehydrogenase/enoyl-CoA hydratase/3-hydroxybutyryl-CoA epimerase